MRNIIFLISCYHHNFTCRRHTLLLRRSGRYREWREAFILCSIYGNSQMYLYLSVCCLCVCVCVYMHFCSQKTTSWPKFTMRFGMCVWNQPTIPFWVNIYIYGIFIDICTYIYRYKYVCFANILRNAYSLCRKHTHTVILIPSNLYYAKASSFQCLTWN